MAESYLLVFNWGAEGVNVDLSPLHRADNQFTKAQNIISDPLGVEQGLKNRPGLIKLSDLAAGTILGGIGLPLPDLSPSGTHYIYIGRGPA